MFNGAQRRRCSESQAGEVRDAGHCANQDAHAELPFRKCAVCAYATRAVCISFISADFVADERPLRIRPQCVCTTFDCEMSLKTFPEISRRVVGHNWLEVAPVERGVHVFGEAECSIGRSKTTERCRGKQS
ncbi:hypothetical protein EVAR_93960_1 [Eumeta japonica]|uniref:Uncharacterized protein n=1 Tax=Eumeta variegata TaxID=151549 RepID=A0A4C1TP87_EUMVA|nr:hypothetical protein EVAR_93960_1 [Eumeta japonica]